MVRIHGHGVVSSRELQDLPRDLLADPAFDAGFRCLTDLSEVTTLTVESATLAERAGQTMRAFRNRQSAEEWLEIRPP